MAAGESGSGTPPRVTAVIVDYRKGGRVLRGVASLRRQYDPARLDIVVVDNSECARNAALLRGLAALPNVRLVISPRNLGYSAGCNEGARLGRGDLLLLLNPDILWQQEGALGRLAAFMAARPEIAIAGPRQANEDGSAPGTVRRHPSPAAQLLRRTALRGMPPFAAAVAAYERPDFDYGRSQPVDWLQSSCMLIRRDFWDAIGGLDECFFLFMADCDLCRAAWRAGREVWHVAEATVTADGRRASAGGPLALLRSRPLRWHLADMVRYYRKHGWRLPQDAIRGAAPAGRGPR